MKLKKSTGLLLAALFLAITAVLQGIALARYLTRMPEDWVGIGLYIAAVVLFTIASLGFSISWVREKRSQQQGEQEI
ncbi:MAG: hypothetical protein SVO26_05945 [Chloroflexota bacterium]|nr:hypothetical protein [Chloroflexota bacterium]